MSQQEQSINNDKYEQLQDDEQQQLFDENKSQQSQQCDSVDSSVLCDELNDILDEKNEIQNPNKRKLFDLLKLNKITKEQLLEMQKMDSHEKVINSAPTTSWYLIFTLTITFVISIGISIEHYELLVHCKSLIICRENQILENKRCFNDSYYFIVQIQILQFVQAFFTIRFCIDKKIHLLIQKVNQYERSLRFIYLFLAIMSLSTNFYIFLTNLSDLVFRTCFQYTTKLAYLHFLATWMSGLYLFIFTGFKYFIQNSCQSINLKELKIK